jgi:hypothetical protein
MDVARERIGALSEAAETAASDTVLDALLARASAKLEYVDGEDCSEIIDLIEAIRYAGGDGNSATVEESRSQLQDVVFYLET